MYKNNRALTTRTDLYQCHQLLILWCLSMRVMVQIRARRSVLLFTFWCNKKILVLFCKVRTLQNLWKQSQIVFKIIATLLGSLSLFLYYAISAGVLAGSGLLYVSCTQLLDDDFFRNMCDWENYHTSKRRDRIFVDYVAHLEDVLESGTLSAYYIVRSKSGKRYSLVREIMKASAYYTHLHRPNLIKIRGFR